MRVNRERERQRRKKGGKYTTCPQHNPKKDRKSNRELWFTIVPDFSPVLSIVHPAKKKTREN